MSGEAARRGAPSFLYLRKPALDLSDIVRYPCTVINRSIVVRALAARSPELLGRAEGQANAAFAARRRAGLDGESADRAIIMPPRCASSSDTVQENEYQILHLTFL